MIAYSLVSHLIQIVESSRELHSCHALSSKGTLDWLEQWQVTLWSTPTQRQAQQRRAGLLWTIAHDEVPEHPGRKQLHVTKPRHLYNPSDDLAHAF